MRFIQGQDRTQTHLFPISLDQSIAKANEVRFIDLFVDSLDLNDFGFKDVRVRHYGTYGQIEVQKEELPKLLLVENEVLDKIKNIGFADLKIDKEGLVSGKLNRVLKNIK